MQNQTNRWINKIATHISVFHIVQVPADGVQDRLPPNMALWHIEYFKLKEFKTWQMDKGFSNALKQVIKLSCEKCSLYTWRKEAHLSLKTEGYREESEWTGLATFLSVCDIYLTLYPIISFHSFLSFIKPSVKPLRFNYFFGSSFPSEGSHVT